MYLNKKLKLQKGITLIALVVTIIVLLILAGVSVSMITGENGILKKATEASEKTKIATEEEQRGLARYEAGANFENTVYTDSNGEKATIPAGFAPTRIEGETLISEGLVITDVDGNEFVWIPVEDGNIEDEQEENLNDTVAWEKKEYDEMKESVGKYKGFYIGRYEAGSTIERKGFQKEGNGTTEMVVKRDQYSYIWVGWGVYEKSTGDYSEDVINNIPDDPYKGQNEGKGAVYLCRHMYDGKLVGVKSTLCYEKQWDAMLKFINKHGFNTDSDSTKWGNYYSSKFNITRRSVKKLCYLKENDNVASESTWEPAYGSFGANDGQWVLTTGATDRNMAVNIYDVAGNCEEWVMEVANVGERFVVDSGVSSKSNSTLRYCKCRGPLEQTRWSIYLGFRPALYILDNGSK